MDKQQILDESGNEQYPNLQTEVEKTEILSENVDSNADPVRDQIAAADRERRISQMQNKRPQLPVQQDIRRSTFNKFQIQEIKKLHERKKLFDSQDDLEEQQTKRAIIPKQPIQMKQQVKMAVNPTVETNMNNEVKPKVETKSKPAAPPVRQSVTQKYAADLNQAVFHRIPLHFRSMAANLIWIFAFIIFIPEYAAGILDLSGVGLFFVLLSFYVTYLAVGLACNTLMQYLSPDNVHHGQKMQAEYEKVKKLDGHFTFFAECYHYETKVRTRVVYINGNLVTQTYTTTEKVVTHKATQTFKPSHTFDDSGRLAPILASKQVVFINNRVHYKFKNKASRQNYNIHWQNFKSRHKRDTHQTYIDDYVIPGLKQRMTFYVGTKPESMRNIFFIGTILGLIWFVSMYIETKVCRYHVDYSKVLTIAGKTVNKPVQQVTVKPVATKALAKPANKTTGNTVNKLAKGPLK